MGRLLSLSQNSVILRWKCGSLENKHMIDKAIKMINDENDELRGLSRLERWAHNSPAWQNSRNRVWRRRPSYKLMCA